MKYYKVIIQIILCKTNFVTITLPVKTHKSPHFLIFASFSYYLAQKLCFWTGIIFIGVYVSVCVCLSVCECLYRLSQKVLDRF